MIVIPAIDLLDGKVVRLSQGDYTKSSIYATDPVELAKNLEEQGFTHLHLVDLNGAREGKIIHAGVVKKIALETRLTIDFGGGIRSNEDVAALMEAGVTRINCGSLAIKQPEKIIEWLRVFGSEKIILSADVRSKKISVSGWTENTAVGLSDLIKQFIPHGLQFVTCTDITRDGMLSGPALELYTELLGEFNEIKLIASGGIRTSEDLISLREAGLYGAITGKALLEGQLDAAELKSKYLL